MSNHFGTLCINAGALLTDLSKAFDCLDHELLTVKLNAYGFDIEALKFNYSYLQGRKQRTKIDPLQSFFAETLFGVPHGSVIGTILFNT